MTNDCPEMSFPNKIFRGSQSLDQLKSIAEKLGKRAFILGGNRALQAALPLMNKGLETIDVVQSVNYGGECSQNNIDVLTGLIEQHEVDFIIAVGGGKALDTGKLVAEQVGLPIVTIPTIAATCAAIATVSILYDNDGQYLDFCMLKNAPDCVILDPQLIAKAPVKWLSAGLGDTLAKLYEYRVVSSNNPASSLNMSAFSNSQLCFDVISRFGPDAYRSVLEGEASFALEQAMDAIFIYAGFTSIMGVGSHVAAAHGLYNGFTINDKTRHFGHGLLVGYGNLCLLALENRDDSEILKAIQLAKTCGVPVTLSEIAELSETELNQIIDAAIETSDIQDMPFVVTRQDMLLAMKRVDTLAYSVSMAE
ncbi:iron-containing alcohol dehydrogenase family protein [Vibrio sp. MA40-2]|uniref:iron-containing alcohol dehydrogenase family protein n=1 Tax=Vibrio sp. MA40-2 TaxID=3391828 RepID=UPI0039A60026